MANTRDFSDFETVRQVSHLINDKKHQIIRLCQELIQIPSVTGHEGPVQEFIAKYLRKLGLELDIWEPDLAQIKEHPAYNDDGLDYTGRPNVVAIRRGKGGGRSLLLNAHSDVVTPGPLEKWTRDPWGGEIAEGKIWGRGALDDKFGTTSIIKALETVLELGIDLAGDVILELVVGEEWPSNGNGTLASTLRGYTADGAIIAESTGCRLMLAHRGNLFWRVVISAKGGHAGDKYRGVSAVEKAIVVFNALVALEQERNRRLYNPLYEHYPLKTPICIGKFHGGELIAGLPETCVLEGDMEFLPGEKPEDVKGEFENTIAKCADSDWWLKRNPPCVQWLGAVLEPAEISRDHPLVATMERSYQSVVGKYPEKTGAEFGCDMRLKVLYGKTPSLIFGPGGSGAHTVNECVSIEDLILVTKVLAVSIVEWCSRSREI
jgi:acetylornithine deacetylase